MKTRRELEKLMKEKSGLCDREEFLMDEVGKLNDMVSKSGTAPIITRKERA
jgi:hypothetical protein